MLSKEFLNELLTHGYKLIQVYSSLQPCHANRQVYKNQVEESGQGVAGSGQSSATTKHSLSRVTVPKRVY